MGRLIKDIEGLVGTALKIAESVNAVRRNGTKPASGKVKTTKKAKVVSKRVPKVAKPPKNGSKTPTKRKKPVKKPPVNVIKPPTPKPAVAWPAYRADDFFQHGNPAENDYRTAALNAAKSAALNCIRCRVSFGMGDELGMHLVKLEHPDRPGYFLERDGWFFRSKEWGVTRWQHDLGTPDLAGAKRWLWLTKAYTKDELQYVVTRATPPEVLNLLNANPAGVTVVLE